MQLSQDIIYYQLSKYFDTTFTVRDENFTEFKRPRFFENSKNLSGHVVVLDQNTIICLDNEHLFFQDVLLICVNYKIEYSKTIFPSIITINNNVNISIIFNRLMDIFDNFFEWEQLLKLSKQYKNGYKQMIDSCILITPEAVCIMDHEFQYIAYSDFAPNQGVIESPDGHDDAVPKYVLEEYYTLPEVNNLKKSEEVFFHSFSFGDSYLKNLFYNQKYIGRIAVRAYGYCESEHYYFKIVFNKLANSIIELYDKYQTFWPEHTTKNEFRSLLSNCISGEDINRQKWESEFLSFGWKMNDNLQLVQFSSHLRYDKNPYSKHIISETEKLWKSCIGFEHESKTFLLINLDSIDHNQHQDIYQLLTYYVRDNLLIAGISRVFKNINALKGAYLQTTIAITEGRLSSPTQWYFFFDNYSLQYMLSSSLGKFSNTPVYLCSAKLQLLLQHDQEKGTEYFLTLEQYFKCRLNATETAKKLFIHRSSFLNRLERIQKLISIDFDSNDEILYLLLSFRHLNSNEG